MSLRFDILARCNASAARVGRVDTPHGSFDTPAFMPVGTKASIKGLTPDHVVATGSQIILNNAYHLMLRPGDDLIARLGGVHRFMQWKAPILTDSGGYQAFSMSGINSIDDDGVTFASIVDGTKIHLSPERAIQVQNNLGADIIMAFDDCPPAGGLEVRLPDAHQHRVRLRVANERTIRWLERCVRAHARKNNQALFGIVQGGTDEDLRRESVQAICNIDLPGYAIGGVAVGESPELIHRVVQFTAPLLPDAKPRYLMGVGYERDIVTAVKAGVDMFDCVLPTRNARNANVFTSTGRMHLTNAKYREDVRVIEEGCDCLACGGTATGDWGLGAEISPLSPQSFVPSPASSGFTRAYLRHLFMADEMLGPILATIHNIRHFQRLMLDIRRAIRENDWLRFDRAWPVARLEAALVEDQPDAPTTV